MTKTKAKKKVPAGAKPPEFAPILTDCAKEYGSLMAYPYVRQHKACVPTIPAFPSRKMSVYASGTAAVNSTGAAFATMNPGHGIVNNSNHFLYTSKASGSSPQIGVSSGDANQIYSNSDYASIAGIQYRVVTAGLRVCYSGQIKDTGGTITLVETSDHESVTGLIRSDLAAYDESATYVMQPGEWYSVEWHPADPVELNYVDSPTATPPSSNPLGFAIDGIAGQEFLVEAYCHYEVIGKAARSKTRSHADPTGMAAALAVNSSPGGRRPSAMSNRAGSGRDGVVGKITNRLSAMAHYVIKGISGVARTAAKEASPARFLKHATDFVSSNMGGAIMGATMKAAPLLLAL